MLSFLPLPLPLPGSDVKIARDIATDPVPVPAPTPGITIPGVNIPGITTPGTGSSTKPASGSKTGSGADVLSALAAPAAEAFMSGALKQQQQPVSINPSSGADGRSGDAFSQSTFGDMIINGSKGTNLTTVLIVIGCVGAGLLLLKRLGKK